MGDHEPLKFSDSRAGQWVGVHQTDFAHLQAVFEGVVEIEQQESVAPERWRCVLPEGVTFIRTLGSHSALIRVPGAEITNIVIKLALPRADSPLRRLAGQLRHSRSQRRYLWAQRLRALGVDTARPLGFVERAQQPALAPSFFATEYIHAPTMVMVRDSALPAIETGGNTVLERRAPSA